jgi:CBS domain-containing protein
MGFFEAPVSDMTYRVDAEGLDPEKAFEKDVMSSDPDAVSSDTTAIKTLCLMQDVGYRRIPIVDGNRVLGVASHRDF